MKKPMRYLIFAGFCLLSTALFETGTAQAQEHMPPGGSDLGTFFSNCAAQMNSMPVDMTLTTTASVIAPFFFDVDCFSYTWIRFPPSVKAITLAADYRGPNINSSAWDCNHSTITYALFRRVGSGPWEVRQVSQRFGFLRSNGTCSHAGDAGTFPPPIGPNWQTDTSTGAEYRLAVQSWQHNDPALSHPGTACGELSCFWKTAVRVSTLNH